MSHITPRDDYGAGPLINRMALNRSDAPANTDPSARQIHHESWRRIYRQTLAKCRMARCDCLSRRRSSDSALLAPSPRQDRKSVVSGKSVSLRVDIGGASIIKKKNKTKNKK